jgi:hypothetical protein
MDLLELAHRLVGEVKPGQLWQLRHDLGNVQNGEKFLVEKLIDLGDKPYQHVWRCILGDPTYHEFRLYTWQILAYSDLIEAPDAPQT